MPHLSERKSLMRDVELWIAFCALLGNSKDEEDAVVLYGHLSDSRYLSRRPYRLREDYFFTTKFARYSDTAFRKTFRTAREGFAAITTLIQDHPVFYSNSNRPQAHPG
ncbi:hypothetical protein BGZ51_008360 [Haplosporangium sp. Z 767]|nr:hypothetical protein BGZ51_008360 [Haplosporangium sp. Z 767]